MHPQGVYYLVEQHRKRRESNTAAVSHSKIPNAAPLDLRQTPRQTPRLSLAQVKKAAAYPSALAARHGSLRRPSVTSAPEISQTTEENEASPTTDVPPVLIRQP